MGYRTFVPPNPVDLLISPSLSPRDLMLELPIPEPPPHLDSSHPRRLAPALNMPVPSAIEL